MEVTRAGKRLQVGYVLPDEQIRKSELALLSEKVAAKGQTLECVVSIKLPPAKHVYSMHKKGFGVPTQLEFRGRGFELIGSTREPAPRKIETEGLKPQWVLDGNVQLKQGIRITDPNEFLLLIHAYPQVCDAAACHEFRAVVGNDGSGRGFFEFRGNYEKQKIARSGNRKF